MKIAAVQMNAVFADVQANLVQAEQHVKKACSLGAELVVLPEFFTSAIGFSDQMLEVPARNAKVHDVLLHWAALYNVIIGGSYIKFAGTDAYNTFELVFPNGEAYEHKKDIPTQFENCYYTNGDNNNILVTPAGNFGVALCWELIRYDAVKRIAGNADVVLSGSCWWDLPQDAAPEREPLRRYNQELALASPATFAKLVHIPVVHASHCGQVAAFRFPDADKLQVRQLVGGAQIIDEKGQVLALRKFFEGAGIVVSDIPLSPTGNGNINEYPSKFWIPDLPESYLNAWETLNPQGKRYYATTALPHYQKAGIQ